MNSAQNCWKWQKLKSIRHFLYSVVINPDKNLSKHSYSKHSSSQSSKSVFRPTLSLSNYAFYEKDKKMTEFTSFEKSWAWRTAPTHTVSSVKAKRFQFLTPANFRPHWWLIRLHFQRVAFFAVTHTNIVIDRENWKYHLNDNEERIE